MSKNSATNTSNTPSQTLVASDDKPSCSSNQSLKKRNKNDFLSNYHRREENMENNKEDLREIRDDTLYNCDHDPDKLSQTDHGRLPEHFRVLLDHFPDERLQKAHSLFLFVYAVGIEAGFIEKSIYEEMALRLAPCKAKFTYNAISNLLKIASVKPKFYTNYNKTQFTMKLHSLIDEKHKSDDYIYALLSAFVIGNDMIVNLTPAYSLANKSFSTVLSIEQLIFQRPSQDYVPQLLVLNQSDLIYILREELFVPMRCQHSSQLEVSYYPSLNGLPVQVYPSIFKYLNNYELYNLSIVNKNLCDLVKSSRKTSRLRN